MTKRYLIEANNTILSLQAALEDYYGAGVTIHGQDGAYISFSIPALTDRVFRMQNTGSFWVGESAGTGTTIVGSRTVAIPYNNPGTAYNYHAVFTPNGFFIVSANMSNGMFACFRSTSGYPIVLGLVNTSNSAGHGGAYALDTLTEINMATINAGSYTYPDGSLVSFPIFFHNLSGQLILDGSGNPVELLDLRQTPTNSYILDSSSVLVAGGTKYRKNADAYGTTITNGIMIETPTP